MLLQTICQKYTSIYILNIFAKLVITAAELVGFGSSWMIKQQDLSGYYERIAGGRDHRIEKVYIQQYWGIC